MNGDSYSRGSRQTSGREYGSRDDRRERDSHRERDRPRRRSRSPGHRGPRAEYDADSYSSSRGYREREREDRYAGRDRRGGDRDWNRDRGAFDRRDRRDAPPRRDRDGFDDRRDDRRGGPRRDDGFPSQRRDRRSASPPRKPKEPTPDLTDIVPVMERRRRLTQWDIKPQGYENITAEQAKLSGMFPLPGAPRQQQMDQSRLEAFLQAPGNSASSAALKPSNARQAKRMFVYNIPRDATDDQVKDFFNLHMSGLNVVNGRDPCLSAQISKDKDFAMLEFRAAEDATVSFVLDGVEMAGSHANGSNGNANPLESGLLIKRPKDYIAPAKSEDTDMDGQVANTVADTPFKICLTRLPLFIEEEQAKELLASFGELKSFVLVRDTSSGESRGVAFCEYRDAEKVTEPAIDSINGMDLGDNKLKLFKACVGTVQVDSEMSVNAMSMLARTQTKEVEHSRVLCLHNMVIPEELMDQDEYEEICEDVKDECVKFGEVLDMKVPRPSGGSKQSDGVGKIYVKFDSAESASKALQALAGRRFAERTVVASYFAEEYFDVSAW